MAFWVGSRYYQKRHAGIARRIAEKVLQGGETTSGRANTNNTHQNLAEGVEASVSIIRMLSPAMSGPALIARHL